MRKMLYIMIVIALGGLGTAIGQTTNSQQNQQTITNEPIKVSPAEFAHRYVSSTSLQSQSMIGKTYEITFEVADVEDLHSGGHYGIYSVYYDNAKFLIWIDAKDTEMINKCEKINKGDHITVRGVFTSGGTVSSGYLNVTDPYRLDISLTELVKVGN